jgi:hypothetical protein
MLPAYAAAADQTQEAIQRIVDAGKQIPRGAQASVLALNAALDGLQDAVDEARSLGVADEAIEDALGPWPGAATNDSVGVSTLHAPRPRLHLVR